MSPARELQKACKALYIWYLTRCIVSRSRSDDVQLVTLLQVICRVYSLTLHHTVQRESGRVTYLEIL